MIKTTSGIMLFLMHTAIAQGSIITFEPPRCFSCDSTLTSYEEEGVLFTGHFSHYGMGIVGTAVNESTGAVRLTDNSKISIQLIDGSAFSLETIGLAEFSGSYRGSRQTVTFTGTRPDKTTVSQSFLLDGTIDGSGGLDDFEAFVFSSDFKHLVRVDISNSMFSMDNITLSAIPVPAAMWLFISGLIGLVAIAKCKAGKSW